MVYAPPPQIGNPNNSTYSGYYQARTWQNPYSTTRAKQSIAAYLPHMTVMEMFYGDNGKPMKAYTRDAHGHYKTVTFDNNQNVSRVTNGCH